MGALRAPSNGRRLCQKAFVVPTQILATATRQPAAASSSSCLRRRRTVRQSARILSVAPSRRGKRQPALGGRDEVVARGQISVYETSSPEGRRGQKELGGESKRPPKEDQGRVGGGKTARRRVESWGSHRGGLLSPRSCPSTHDPRPASNGGAKESREGPSPTQGMDQRAHHGGRRAKRRRLIRVRAIARILLLFQSLTDFSSEQLPLVRVIRALFQLGVMCCSHGLAHCIM